MTNTCNHQFVNVVHLKVFKVASSHLYISLSLSNTCTHTVGNGEDKYISRGRGREREREKERERESIFSQLYWESRELKVSTDNSPWHVLIVDEIDCFREEYRPGTVSHINRHTHTHFPTLTHRKTALFCLDWLNPTSSYQRQSKGARLAQILIIFYYWYIQPPSALCYQPSVVA